MEVKLWTAGMWFPVRCQTDEQFTSEFSGIRWTFSSGVIPGEMSGVCRRVFCSRWSIFHQDSLIAHEARCYDFSYYSWKVFIICPPSFSSTTWSMKRWWVVSIRPTRSLLHLNFNFNYVFCVVIDSIYAWTATYCIILCTVTFTVLLYCYCDASVTSVCPSISEKHYQILSICRELGYFFFNHKNTYPLDIFHLSIILLKLLLPITNCLLLPT